MTPEQTAARLEALSDAWCPTDLVHELLGIDLTADPQLSSTFRTWSARFRSGAEVERSTGSGLLIHRHAFETFLLQNGWVSWKWAAAHAALDEKTFRAVVSKLQEQGALPQLATGVSDQIVRQREASTVHRLFPSLRLRAFSTHSSMCRALHEAIRADLTLAVEPLLCVTSAILDPQQPDLADAFDAITLEPVGLRYQVWLDTRKPVNLRPDVCSLKLYAQQENVLRDHVVGGSAPARIDEKLRAA